jgi:hypothetical protein
MGGSSSRNKGSAAERSLRGFFSDHLGWYLQKNGSQSNLGGYDCTLLDVPNGRLMVPFALEFKHHKTPNVQAWWKQTVDQAQKTKLIPVLFHRGDNQPWKIVIPSYLQTGRKREVDPLDWNWLVTLESKDRPYGLTCSLLFVELCRENAINYTN